MTVKEACCIIDQELSALYPATERESITFLVFNHLLGFKRFDTEQKKTEELTAPHTRQIYNIIEQLKLHKPIQYVLGETEFYGLTFFVDHSVLIPRPETEELVHWIINDYQGQAPTILDIGTGSGCIPVSLAKNLTNARITGIDISDKALDIAKKNATSNNVDVTFTLADILIELHPNLGLFDVIVSNPPYVTAEQKWQMEPNVLNHEPHLALFVPENDPLLFYKAITRFAQKHLYRNGSLYFEINEALPFETAEMLQKAGFSTELRKDLNDKYRMIKAKPL